MGFKASELGTSDLTVEFRKEKETHLSRIRITQKQSEGGIRTALKQLRKLKWNTCVYGWTRFFLRPTVKPSFGCRWAVWLGPRYIVSLNFSFHIGNRVNLIGPL